MKCDNSIIITSSVILDSRELGEQETQVGLVVASREVSEPNALLIVCIASCCTPMVVLEINWRSNEVSSAGLCDIDELLVNEVHDGVVLISFLALVFVDWAHTDLKARVGDTAIRTPNDVTSSLHCGSFTLSCSVTFT